MSLEEVIKANTAALEANTAAVNKLLAKAQGAAGSDKGGDKPKADADKGDKDKGEGTGTRGRGRAAAKDKAPTAAEMKDKATAFLEAADGDDDYAARRAIIGKIVKKFDAAKFTEIGEDDRAAALKLLADEAKKLEEDADQGDNGDDDVV